MHKQVEVLSICQINLSWSSTKLGVAGESFSGSRAVWGCSPVSHIDFQLSWLLSLRSQELQLSFKSVAVSEPPPKTVLCFCGLHCTPSFNSISSREQQKGTPRRQGALSPLLGSTPFSFKAPSLWVSQLDLTIMVLVLTIIIIIAIVNIISASSSSS